MAHHGNATSNCFKTPSRQNDCQQTQTRTQGARSPAPLWRGQSIASWASLLWWVEHLPWTGAQTDLPEVPQVRYFATALRQGANLVLDPRESYRCSENRIWKFKAFV